MSSGSRPRPGSGGATAHYHPSRLAGLHCSTLVDEGPPRACLHDRLVLLAVTAGETVAWCRGETHVLRPGSLLVIEPGDVHRDVEKTSYRAITVEVHADLARGLRGSAEEPRWGAPPAASAGPAERVVDLVEAVRARHESTRQQERAASLFRSLAPLPTRAATRSEPPLVTRARRALTGASGSTLSLDELAGRLRCGPTYLCRVFATYVGVGPHAYQLQHRLLEARRLVENGQTVARAAELTGFGDESHLRRHFRRRFAAAPGRYQRELTASLAPSLAPFTDG